MTRILRVTSQPEVFMMEDLELNKTILRSALGRTSFDMLRPTIPHELILEAVELLWSYTRALSA